MQRPQPNVTRLAAVLIVSEFKERLRRMVGLSIAGENELLIIL